MFLLNICGVVLDRRFACGIWGSQGWYDEREEKYVTDSDAEIANFKDAFGSPLKRMSEDSYFFRMGK